MPLIGIAAMRLTNNLSQQPKSSSLALRGSSQCKRRLATWYCMLIIVADGRFVFASRRVRLSLVRASSTSSCAIKFDGLVLIHSL
jgi:hypothetical protein